MSSQPGVELQVGCMRVLKVKVLAQGASWHAELHVICPYAWDAIPLDRYLTAGEWLMVVLPGPTREQAPSLCPALQAAFSPHPLTQCLHPMHPTHPLHADCRHAAAAGDAERVRHPRAPAPSCCAAATTGEPPPGCCACCFGRCLLRCLVSRGSSRPNTPPHRGPCRACKPSTPPPFNPATLQTCDPAGGGRNCVAARGRWAHAQRRQRQPLRKHAGGQRLAAAGAAVHSS